MLAILYDVHGNLPALEAVLADAAGRGADRFLLGGDFAAMGRSPAACVRRLEALPVAAAVRGNWERWQGDPAAAPGDPALQEAAASVIAALGADVVARHAALPLEADIDGVLFCHASPKDDMSSFAPQGDDPAADEDLLAGTPATRVVFGHTHQQFARTTATGVELANPGSVGMPLDGDQRAAYALLDDAGALELRRVAYDHEAEAAALEALGPAWAVATAARLRAARFAV
jgi:diadenosine tetraphosphatase ApaH/serine/threonine PP2A family protein phosphatase